MGDFSIFNFKSDFVNVLYVPFMIATVLEIKANWAGLTDNHLTWLDRSILMRAVIFLLLPIIVFLHEGGHYLAALSVGAKVMEFHYGPATGFVRIFADRTAAQFLWIAFAGNLVQIVIGLLALAAAPLFRSPPLVALCVYFGLFAVADTAIFYALLSAVGLYGDWIDIYTNSERNWVLAIGVFHVLLLALLAVLFYGAAPRTWFARRTMPEWFDEHQRLESQARLTPTFETLQALCLSWLRAGFADKASAVLATLSPLGDGPQLKLLQARVLMSKGKVEKACQCFTSLIDDDSLNERGRARLCVEAGEIMMAYRNFPEALKLFSKGAQLDPFFGEAGLFKAIMLNSMDKHAEALEALPLVSHPQLVWSYPENEQRVQEEAERARAALDHRENKSKPCQKS